MKSWEEKGRANKDKATLDRYTATTNVVKPDLLKVKCMINHKAHKTFLIYICQYDCFSLFFYSLNHTKC